MKYKQPTCYQKTGIGYQIINLFIHHSSEKDHLHNIIEYIKNSGKLVFKQYVL